MSIEEQQIREQTLREAAAKVEALAGNEKYQQAWKRAGAVIRGMIEKGTTKVPDEPKQISSNIIAGPRQRA